MFKHRPLRLLLFMLVGAALATGTLVPRVSLEEMIDDSAFIVHGTVVRKWAAWDNGRQFIWTHYELQISDALKGFPGVKVVVSEPGGVIGESGMHIAGTPQYRVGDEVVVFLTRTPVGYLRTCGWGQGRFNIQDAAANDGKVVRSASTGVTLVEAPPSGEEESLKTGQTPLRELNGLSLAAFKERVKALVRERQAEGGR